MARTSYIKEPTIEVDRSEDSGLNRDQYRGFKGKAVKIHVYGSDGMHDKASPWIPLSLGDLPTVWVHRGIDWIIPEEYLGVLQDTAVQTFEHELLRMPDASGNFFREVPKILNRFQFRVLGEVPWSEYEDWRSKLRKDVLPTKN